SFGCGITLTLMPVSFVNRFASARSRTCPPPTESPMNVIDCPPYLALMALALGTGGAGIVAASDVPDAGRAVPALAALIDATAATISTAGVASRMIRRFTRSVLSPGAQAPGLGKLQVVGGERSDRRRLYAPGSLADPIPRRQSISSTANLQATRFRSE